MLGDFTCKVAFQLLAYLWPAYQCSKDVRRDDSPEKNERLRLWCIYWAMLAAFTAVQPVLDLFLFWVPLYYEAKLALAVYCWYPSLTGAQRVFTQHVQPLVEAHEPAVDARVEEISSRTTSFVRESAVRAFNSSRGWILDAVVRFQSSQAQQGLVAEGSGHAAPAAEASLERQVSIDDAPSPPKNTPRASSRNLSKSASGKKE